MPFDTLSPSERPTLDQVAALVQKLGLLEDPVATAPITGDADKGLYELVDATTVIKSYLFDRFLKGYLDEFPPADRDWRQRLRTGRESMLSAAFREDTVMSLHPLVMKRGLNGETVNLTALTKTICAEDDRNFHRARRGVRDKIMIPMHDLMIWNVTETTRSKTVSYQIGIGEAALHYHRLVFKTLLLDRLRHYLRDIDNRDGV